MDVTSLLNSSSAALQRRDSIGSSTPSATGDTTATSTAVPTPSPGQSPSGRTSGAVSPNRNRTPWDAGGYSLPLTLDTTSIPKFTSNMGRPAFYNSSYSPTGDGSRTNSTSPKSPTHKFSDSRSSLSSYTSSSTTSLSHSRISSLSTVSEHQPFTAVFSDQLPLTYFADRSTSSFTDHPTTSVADYPTTSVDDHPTSSADDYPTTSVADNAPSSFVGTRTSFANSSSSNSTMPPKLPKKIIVADLGVPRHSNNSSPANDHRMPTGRQAGADNLGPPMVPPGSYPAAYQIDSEPYPYESVGSPSDAVMIRRGSDSALGSDNAPDQRPTNGYLQPQAEPTRAHRRTVSAPDFSGVAAPVPGDASSPIAIDDSVGTPALIAANNSVGTTPTYPGSYRGPNLEPIITQAQLDDKIADFEALRKEIEEGIVNRERPCMYQTKCTLPQVNVRKAISHILGRNKACTRRIPDPVWTHFCRKHYQRCRYRNGPEYAITQSRLIQEQLFRVQVWSDHNQRQGRPEEGTLVDWALAIRKREKMRVAKKEGKSRKKEDLPEEIPGEDDQSSSDDDEKPSAVNIWLHHKLRTGYSTREMIKLAMQIQVEVESSGRQAIPDVEILPNIKMGGEGLGSIKRPKPGAHKPKHAKAYSTGMALVKPEEPKFISRRPSHPIVGTEGRQDDEPARKRQRIQDIPDEFRDSRRETPRTENRTVPSMQPIPERRMLPTPLPGYGNGMNAGHQRSLSDAGAFTAPPLNPWGAPTYGAHYSQQHGGFPPAPSQHQSYSQQPYANNNNNNNNNVFQFHGGSRLPTNLGPEYDWSNQGNGQPLPPPSSYQSQPHQPEPYMGSAGPRYGSVKHARHNSSPAPMYGSNVAPVPHRLMLQRPSWQVPMRNDQEATSGHHHSPSTGSTAGNNGSSWQRQSGAALYQAASANYSAQHQQAAYPLAPAQNTNGNMSRVGENGGTYSHDGTAGENGEKRDGYEQNQYPPRR